MNDACSSALSAVECAVLMEEGVARISHQLRNHLAAVRNAAFYISKRFAASELSSDPRLAQFFQMIDEELEHATGALAKGSASSKVRVRGVQALQPSALVSDAVASFEAEGRQVSISATIEPGSAEVDAEEFGLAIRRMLDAAALESGAACLELSACPRESGYEVAVAAALCQTPSAEQLASIELAWSIVRRVAVMHGAEFYRKSDLARLRAVLFVSPPAPAEDSSEK